MLKLKFRKFTSDDAEKFKSLNVEWLEKFFKVEPIDERVLSNPKSEILDPGGFIVMAEIDSKVIGTFAYIKKGDLLYEFSKMAINPNQRGKGYGNIMMKYAISFAKK